MIRDLIARGFGFQDGTRFIPTLGLGAAVTPAGQSDGSAKPMLFGNMAEAKKRKRRRQEDELILAILARL